MRILAVSGRYPDEFRAGFGNFVERQMRELAARPGIEVRVVAPMPQPPMRWLSTRRQRHLAALPAEEVRGDLHVYRPRYAVAASLGLSAWTLPRALLRIGRGIRSEWPFDIVTAEFSWPEGPAVACLGKALGVPFSIKARGIDFELSADRRLRRKSLLGAARNAAVLLAVSEDVRDQMVAHGLPATRIDIHYPAVDSARFDIRDRSAAKAALGLSGIVLLSVGNLTATKRQRLAIEALVELPEATLVVVGTGPEERRLRGLADDLGLTARVRFVGSIPNALMPTFYNAADMLVHCPAIEGFANVRLEALACGTPVVTTAVGEARRLVTAAGAVIIVAPESAAIGAAVERLIAEAPRRAATRSTVLDYSWAKATDQLEAYLRAGIARRS